MARRRENGAGVAEEDVEAAEQAIGGRLGHNAKARRSSIKKVCRDLAGLIAQRDEVSASIRELKQKVIKGDLGMKIGDFNTAFRLYSLEDDARDLFLDTLRETFEALGVGQQLSFLDAGERSPTSAEGSS